MDEVERAATVIMENEAKTYRAKCLLAAENVPGGYGEMLAEVWGVSVREVYTLARLGRIQMIMMEATNE